MQRGISSIGLDRRVMQRAMDGHATAIVIRTVRGGADLDGQKCAEGGDEQEEKVGLIESHAKSIQEID